MMKSLKKKRKQKIYYHTTVGIKQENYLRFSDCMFI